MDNSPSPSLTLLEGRKSDAEIAADLKKRLQKALDDHVLPIFKEAKILGLDVGWDAIGWSPAPYNLPMIVNLKVTRTY
jgi:hypothetical protein